MKQTKQYESVDFRPPNEDELYLLPYPIDHPYLNLEEDNYQGKSWIVKAAFNHVLPSVIMQEVKNDR